MITLLMKELPVASIERLKIFVSYLILLGSYSVLPAQDLEVGVGFTFDQELAQAKKIFADDRMIVSNVTINYFDTEGSGEIINTDKIRFYFALGKYRIEYKRISDGKIQFANVYGFNGKQAWDLDTQKSTLRIRKQLIPNLPLEFNPILPEAGKFLSLQTYATAASNKIELGQEENPFIKLCSEFDVQKYSKEVRAGNGQFELFPPSGSLSSSGDQASASADKNKTGEGYLIEFARTWSKSGDLVLSNTYFIDEKRKKTLSVIYSKWEKFIDAKKTVTALIPTIGHVESEIIQPNSKKIIFSDYSLVDFVFEVSEDELFDPPVESANILKK